MIILRCDCGIRKVTYDDIISRYEQYLDDRSCTHVQLKSRCQCCNSYLVVIKTTEEELMEQFLYECHEKDVDIEIIEEIKQNEKRKSKLSITKSSLKEELMRLTNKHEGISAEKDENLVTFETNSCCKKKPEKKDSRSYASFLEE